LKLKLDHRTDHDEVTGEVLQRIHLERRMAIDRRDHVADPDTRARGRTSRRDRARCGSRNTLAGFAGARDSVRPENGSLVWSRDRPTQTSTVNSKSMIAVTAIRLGFAIPSRDAADADKSRQWQS
jgi:hypothetical protein